MLYREKIIGKNYIYLVTFILICTKFVFSQNDISYENSWAVIIGINNYKNETITDLDYAVNDAQDIGEILIEYYDFPAENIVILLNEEATAFNIKKEISGLAKNANENDRIIIFFSGHVMTEDLPKGGEM